MKLGAALSALRISQPVSGPGPRILILGFGEPSLALRCHPQRSQKNQVCFHLPAFILINMQGSKKQITSHLYRQLERRAVSPLVSELRKERRRALGALDPGRKMQAAFLLSVEARKLLIAGLQAQGFTESEIRNLLRSRQR